MRLLLLSYYPPDLGPGSFRTAALVRALLERLRPEDTLDVITTQPHRLSSARAAEFERDGSLSVRRVRIPFPGSGALAHAVNFCTFARAVLRHVRGRSYDAVYASSSRSMTATLGVVVSKRVPAPLYVDLRDVFVHDVRFVYPAAARCLMPVLHRLENLVIGHASGINLVSPAFLSHFQTKWPRKTWDVVTHGVDEEVLEFDFTAPRANGADSSPRTILYAGTIGHGQALHRIVPALARRFQHRYRFVIVGEGSARRKLAKAVADLPNVSIEPAIRRAELLQLYASSDILFLHLDESEAFDLVLPSKLIEYGATGKPILAGLSGYAARFARQHLPGTAVFTPCDVDDAVSALSSMSMSMVSRSEFLASFDRRRQMRELAEGIIAITSPAKRRSKTA